MKFLPPFELNYWLIFWSLEAPYWEKCDECESFICTAHELHIEDCSCNPSHLWSASPYEH